MTDTLCRFVCVHSAMYVICFRITIENKYILGFGRPRHVKCVRTVRTKINGLCGWHILWTAFLVGRCDGETSLVNDSCFSHFEQEVIAFYLESLNYIIIGITIGR